MACSLVKCRYFQNRKILAARTISPWACKINKLLEVIVYLSIFPKYRLLNSLQLKSECYFLSFLTKTPPGLVLYKYRADRWSLPWRVGFWDLAFLLVTFYVFSELDISTGRPEDLVSSSFPQLLSYVCNNQQRFRLLIFFFLFLNNPVLLYKLFQSLNGAESVQSFLVIASPKSSISLVIVWCITPHLQANWMEVETFNT